MDLGVIRKPTVYDVVNIIKNAREADKTEALMFLGKTIQESLENTPQLYNTSMVWELGGKLLCMYGTTPTEDDDKWVVWMLATDDFDKNRKAARINSKRFFDDITDGKKYLFNYVHVAHKNALRWVKWLGFQVGEPEPVGINGELFCKIEVTNV